MNPEYQEQEFRALSHVHAVPFTAGEQWIYYEDSATGLQKLVDIRYMFIY